MERDVAGAFEAFDARGRKNLDPSGISRARDGREAKLNDLEKFASTFELHTPVPSDPVSGSNFHPKELKDPSPFSAVERDRLNHFTPSSNLHLDRLHHVRTPSGIGPARRDATLRSVQQASPSDGSLAAIGGGMPLKVGRGWLLPSATEMTTGVSRYSTPAYAMSMPMFG